MYYWHYFTDKPVKDDLKSWSRLEIQKRREEDRK